MLPELTNREKIDILNLASQIVYNDEAIIEKPKDKNVIGLYHAMIRAITAPVIDQEKKP